MNHFHEVNDDASQAAKFEERMALINRHQRQLYCYILTLLPQPADAEDVLQDTNLILWRKIDGFQPGTSFYAWASRIAYYRVLKRRDQIARDRKVLDDEVVNQIAGDVESAPIGHDARRDALFECIEKLRPIDRDLIRRRYTDQASGQTLADELKRPLNSIYKSLGRIRRMLMQCINRSLAAESPGEDVA